jgi:spore photoproduct lyase
LLSKTKEYIEDRVPEITHFEGAATSDPIPVEEYTGSLAKTIEFFGHQEYGRFRFVTKFIDVDSLLGLKHNGRTTFRFSINSESVIKRFEHKTPPASERVAAAGKVAAAGYPLGFIIAPIFYYDGWRNGYKELLLSLKAALDRVSYGNKLDFELITHRYTLKAKSNILSLFPETELPMNEEDRRFKYGQFGYGKYMYKQETMDEIKDFFTDAITELFPDAAIKYFV